MGGTFSSRILVAGRSLEGLLWFVTPVCRQVTAQIEPATLACRPASPN